MQLETTYVPSKITEKFVTEFHKETTQRHNRATALITKLRQKYIVRNI